MYKVATAIVRFRLDELAVPDIADPTNDMTLSKLLVASLRPASVSKRFANVRMESIALFTFTGGSKTPLDAIIDIKLQPP
jgi:hypothetical protein